MEKKRLKSVILFFSLIITIGAVYAVICSIIGFGIPCVFYELTGFKCPGCGISRFFLDMMKLDFMGALKNNYAAVFIVIYIIMVAVHSSRVYIKTGKRTLDSGNNVVNIIFLAGLLLWWIFRNLLEV